MCALLWPVLRKSLDVLWVGVIIWRPDEFLSAEEGLASSTDVDFNQPGSCTTLLTSETSSDRIAACLVQHGCKDMTNHLDLGQCDQHVFTRGGFGAIYRGVLDDGRPIAIKCIECVNDCEDPEPGKNLKRIARETYVWSHCNHQGILPVLGFAHFRGQMVLIAPWRGAGSLKQHVSRGLLRLPLRACIQLVAAVKHLHANGIVHRDIKPDNVIMTDQGETQLADFGSATLTHTGILNFTCTGSFNSTIRFAAPGVLCEKSRAFTKESDIYALGMTIFNVMSGQLPFADKSAPSFINAVINMREVPSRPDFDNTLRGGAAKDEMWNLLKRCLNYTPEGRPRVAEVKEAPIKIGKLDDTSNEGVGGDVSSWNDFLP